MAAPLRQTLEGPAPAPPRRRPPTPLPEPARGPAFRPIVSPNGAALPRLSQRFAVPAPGQLAPPRARFSLAVGTRGPSAQLGSVPAPALPLPPAEDDVGGLDLDDAGLGVRSSDAVPELVAVPERALLRAAPPPVPAPMAAVSGAIEPAVFALPSQAPVVRRAPSVPWSPTEDAFFGAGEALEREAPGSDDSFDDLEPVTAGRAHRASFLGRLLGRR